MRRALAGGLAGVGAVWGVFTAGLQFEKRRPWGSDYHRRAAVHLAKRVARFDKPAVLGDLDALRRMLERETEGEPMPDDALTLTADITDAVRRA